jgi:Protein of unknown function (DUF4233)
MSEPDKPSGLRNPAASVRAVGAATLSAEGLVLLLAIVPLRVIADARSTAGTLFVVVLAVLSFGLAGLLRRRWAWYGGTVLQAVLIAGGYFVHGSLVVLGVLFGLVWLYALHVRRTVLGGRTQR